MILWHYVTQRPFLPCYINLPGGGGRFAPEGWPISSGIVAGLLRNMQDSNYFFFHNRVKGSQDPDLDLQPKSPELGLFCAFPNSFPQALGED
jgi:hypothetical protein